MVLTVLTWMVCSLIHMRVSKDKSDSENSWGNIPAFRTLYKISIDDAGVQNSYIKARPRRVTVLQLFHERHARGVLIHVQLNDMYFSLPNYACGLFYKACGGLGLGRVPRCQNHICSQTGKVHCCSLSET